MKILIEPETYNKRIFFNNPKKIYAKKKNHSRNIHTFWYLTEDWGWGWAAGAMSANLPCSISAVFNKGFSLHPPSLLLLACGAARGPPDAYRQMSLVEQNTLCLTSHEATGLLRKLKGCLPSTDRSLKRPTIAFSRSVSSLPKSFGATRRSRDHFSTDISDAGFRKGLPVLGGILILLNVVVIQESIEIIINSQWISGTIHIDECTKIVKIIVYKLIEAKKIAHFIWSFICATPCIWM